MTISPPAGEEGVRCRRRRASPREGVLEEPGEAVEKRRAAQPRPAGEAGLWPRQIS